VPHRGTTSLAVLRAPTGTARTTASFPAVTGCPVRFYWGPAVLVRRSGPVLPEARRW